MADKIFANGIIYKKPENAPDYVIGSLSVKVEEFTGFLKEHANKDWVNLKIMKSKGGKYYVELDTWRTDKKKDTVDIDPTTGQELPF